MTLPILPDSPAAFADARWADILPWYEALAGVPLDTADAVGPWLAAWSRLEELVTEAAAEAMIAYTADTRDPAQEAAHLRFSTEIFPQLEEQGVRLARRLVATGFTRPDLEVVLRRFRSAIEIFREENVPLFSELEELSASYQRITGGMTVEWEGETRTLPQLGPFLKSPDRAVRERAFRAMGAPYVASATSSPASSTGCTPAASRWRATPASPISRPTPSPPSAASTTPRTTVTRFHEAVEAEVVPGGDADHWSAGSRRSASTSSALGSRRGPGQPAAAPPVPRRRRARRAGLAASSTRVDPELGAQFDTHARRATARPGQPHGQGARRLLRDAALSAGGPSSS